jgi:spermidine synthase
MTVDLHQRDPATETTTAERVIGWAPSLARSGTLGDRSRLVALAFLMLFTELALIRWSGSNIVYLSYFSNFVLLGSFLGIGLGFLRARARYDLSGWAPMALGLFVALVWFFPISISQDDPSVFFFSSLTPRGPPRELVLGIVFVFSALILCLITEGLARTFARLENLDAYKFDLVGSILGIAAFSVLSFLGLPPLAWGIVFGVVLVALMVPRFPSLVQVLAVAGLLAVLGIESFGANLQWSPYYKIDAFPNEDADGELQVNVNGVPHQLHQSSEFAPGKHIYEVAEPPRLDEVLVIGSGGGNDVAVALERGAQHVDAVEIDPVLADLGRQSHPDDPYGDPRVDLHINDGRAFLEQSNTDYDLILLALPDSISLLSGQSALRLESYLFTQEAMETARERLSPEGVFAMYNYYRQDWLLDRFGAMLTDVYGTEPCTTTLFPAIGDDGVALDAFVATDAPSSVDCAGEDGEVWAASGATPEAATDDHPFPYLRDRVPPSVYVVTLSTILVVSALAIRVAAGPLRQMRSYIDLFFMGVAFLLLETKNIVQFALLFGTTWFVNALVFGGVLLSVLLAIAVSKRVTFRHPLRLYAFLAASIAVAFFLPASALLNLPAVVRFLVAVAIAFTPIFISNLVFTQRFKSTGDSTTAFGANLLGAMVGGVLEYFSLVTGFRMLLVVVAVVYGLAFLTGRRHLTAFAAP